MLNQPQMKRRVALRSQNPEFRFISFNTSPDDAAEFESYGTVTKHRYLDNHYSLLVDARFDYDEVVAYIEAFGETPLPEFAADTLPAEQPSPTEES